MTPEEPAAPTPGSSPFELEPATPPEGRSRGVGGAGGAGGAGARSASRAGSPAGVPADPAGPRADAPLHVDPATGLDTRTVAERQGTAVPRVHGVRPPPEGWPLEALRYPVTGHGGALLAGTTAAVFALDLLGWPESLRFLSWIVKTPALLFIVRWQLDLIGHSAAGRDAPTGWGHALDVDREGVKGYARYLLWAFVSFLPSRVLWLLGPSVLGWVNGTAAWETGLLIIGSAWMAVIALSTALEAPALKRPWVTVVWLFYRPLTCLVGSIGWWALGVAEVTIYALSTTETWASIPAALVLRAASVYALMVSARVLGVLGRSWDPERTGPA